MHLRRPRPAGPLAGVAATVAVALMASACAYPSGTAAHATSTAEVRIGYLPNVTHAPAIVGLQEGLFAAALPPNTSLTAHAASAGPELIEALWSGAIDVAYLGPSPTVNAHVRSEGSSLRIVAGATSGGAALVTRPDLRKPEDLRGRVLATPGLGNTQDIALRSWLADHGLATSLHGGGDVSIRPQPPAQILETFREGHIDGAWVPEPWAIRLVQEAGGRVLLEERDLWPATGGEHVTTHVIVATSFLEAHPHLVEAVLEAHLDALARLQSGDPGLSQVVADGISAVTGSRPSLEITAAALDRLTFTADPIAESLQGAADDAVALGLLDAADLTGIYELTLLNRLLRRAGQAEVAP